MTDGKTSGSVQVGPFGPSGRTVGARIAKDFAHALNHLIHLEYDIARAYETALHRLSSDEHKGPMRSFQGAHGHLIHQLATFVEALGHRPTERGDLQLLVEKSRVLIGQLRGDRGILEAMAHNEHAVAAAYREALALPGMPETTREVIVSALADAARRGAFYDRALGRFVG